MNNGMTGKVILIIALGERKKQTKDAQQLKGIETKMINLIDSLNLAETLELAKALNIEKKPEFGYPQKATTPLPYSGFLKKILCFLKGK